MSQFVGSWLSKLHADLWARATASSLYLFFSRSPHISSFFYRFGTSRPPSPTHHSVAGNGYSEMQTGVCDIKLMNEDGFLHGTPHNCKYKVAAGKTAQVPISVTPVHSEATPHGGIQRMGISITNGALLCCGNLPCGNVEWQVCAALNWVMNSP
jgi:hypothetical protein